MTRPDAKHPWTRANPRCAGRGTPIVTRRTRASSLPDANPTHAVQAAGTIRGEEPAQSQEIDRLERATAWRQDQAERAAICAGLTWQDCVRALVKAKRMSPGTAAMMGVAL
jgi:hypothetical protein